MRSPTKSEQLLLAIFGAMVLVFLGIVIWGWLQRSFTQQRSQELVLREQISELRRWQGEKDIWQARGRWLASNPPPIWAQEDSEAAFVQELQRSMAASGIEILSQRLAGSESVPGFAQVTVQLTIRASTEELVRWLHELQRPGKYLAVTQLNVRADGDGDNLRAEVQLTRFYRVVDGSPMLEETLEMQMPLPDQTQDPADAPEARTPMSPPDIQQPLSTPSSEQLPGVDAAVDDKLEEEDNLPPNPVLPFDDIFDPNNPDEPIQSPAEEVFELLPVPATQ